MTRYLIIHKEGQHFLNAANVACVIADFQREWPKSKISEVLELVDVTPRDDAVAIESPRSDRRHAFHMSETQAERIHKLAGSHNSALKNWLATAVEAGERWRGNSPQELVEELRAHEEIFARFNISAKKEIAALTGKPMEVVHYVEERRR